MQNGGPCRLSLTRVLSFFKNSGRALKRGIFYVSEKGKADLPNGRKPKWKIGLGRLKKTESATF